jgi:hypothetical protein
MLAKMPWVLVGQLLREGLSAGKRRKAGVRTGNANAIGASRAEACGQHTPGRRFWDIQAVFAGAFSLDSDIYHARLILQ